MTPSEARDLARQAHGELHAGKTDGLKDALPPIGQDFNAPVNHAGPDQIIAEIRALDAPVTVVEPVAAIPEPTPAAQEPTPTPPEVQPLSEAEKQRITAEMEAARVKIAELEGQTNDTKTINGTVSSVAPQPVNTQTAGPDTVVIGEHALITLPDGSKITWKELNGQRIQQSRLSKERRELHEEKQAVEREKQRIEKITASGLGRTVLAALESGVPDEKVVDAAAALVGKRLESQSQPEPEMPDQSDPDYETKLVRRMEFLRAQDSNALRQDLASLREELRSAKQVAQKAEESIAQKNDRLIQEMIGKQLPPNLSAQQFAQIKEHLIAVGESIDVPIDDFSFGQKELTAKDVGYLRAEAFPGGRIPASILGQPQPSAPTMPLPQEAALLELQRTRDNLAKLEQQMGLRPPALPSKPAPEAGPQPAVGPNAVQDGHNPSMGAFKQLTTAEARERIQNELRTMRQPA